MRNENVMRSWLFFMLFVCIPEFVRRRTKEIELEIFLAAQAIVLIPIVTL